MQGVVNFLPRSREIHVGEECVRADNAVRLGRDRRLIGRRANVVFPLARKVGFFPPRDPIDLLSYDTFLLLDLFTSRDNKESLESWFSLWIYIYKEREREGK